jgi:hypothetical protein
LYIEWGARRRRFPNTSQRCRLAYTTMHSSLGCARSVYATRGASRQRRLHQRRWQASSRHLSSRRRRTQSDTQLWLSRAPLVHDVGPCSFFDGSLFARNRAWRPLSLSHLPRSLTYSNWPIICCWCARAGYKLRITNSTLAPAAKSGWCVHAPRRWQALTVREHQTPKWSVFLADATPQARFNSGRMRAWQIGCAGRLWQLDQIKLRHSNFGLCFIRTI